MVELGCEGDNRPRAPQEQYHQQQTQWCVNLTQLSSMGPPQQLVVNHRHHAAVKASGGPTTAPHGGVVMRVPEPPGSQPLLAWNQQQPHQLQAQPMHPPKA